MSSALYNRLISLTPPGTETGRDAFNAPIVAPGTPVQTLAEYRALSDAEKMESGEVMASTSARFRVRWSPTLAAITPRWGLNFEGRAFDISGLKELGHRDQIEITASARAER
ncbi:head-tail adaptor protein [Ancylobacter sp. IITR112]|uniref:phage head completion protein n=1 Tax=Ancylobacter sp. IITR112 TaxID=3138073 RepID=UPI00352AFAFE